MFRARIFFFLPSFFLFYFLIKINLQCFFKLFLLLLFFWGDLREVLHDGTRLLGLTIITSGVASSSSFFFTLKFFIRV